MKGKSTSSFATVLVLLAIADFALAVVKTPLALDIWKESTPRRVRSSKLKRRAGNTPITQVFDNADPVYLANVTVGTPGQIVRVWIVTNAADTWVNTDKSVYCKNSTHPCLQYGYYDANASATYNYLYGGFNEIYTDGTGASGDWATDNFLIGGTTVSNLQFGIGYNSSYPVGTLGLGYVGFEQNTTKASYANLPLLLFRDGLINCISYSIWLDQSDSPQGQVLFGAVDTDKFLGTLTTLPISLDGLQYDIISIPLASVQISYGQKNISVTSAPLQIILDQTVDYIALPSNIIGQIYPYLGTTFDSAAFAAFLPCSMQSNATTIDFMFGSTVFAIPMSRLVATYNATTCYFNIIPSNASGLNEIAMGTVFTESAYIVYDFSHNQVSLAPIDTQSSTSNITLIGPNGISTLIGTGPGTNNASSTPPPTNTLTTTQGLSTRAKVGIEGGTGGAGLLLLALAGFFLYRRKRRGTNHAEPLALKPQSQMGNSTSLTGRPLELYSSESLYESVSNGVPRSSHRSEQSPIYEIGSGRWSRYAIAQTNVPEPTELDSTER